ELPGYLDRSELVTRVEPNRVEYSGVARWAAPLRASVPRVLARDLMLLLGTEQVVVFPWFGSVVPRHAVAITVSAFERRADGSATLAATWVLRDAHNQRLDG